MTKPQMTTAFVRPDTAKQLQIFKITHDLKSADNAILFLLDFFDKNGGDGKPIKGIA